jgi:hypothetical protein
MIILYDYNCKSYENILVINKGKIKDNYKKNDN